MDMRRQSKHKTINLPEKLAHRKITEQCMIKDIFIYIYHKYKLHDASTDYESTTGTNQGTLGSHVALVS